MKQARWNSIIANITFSLILLAASAVFAHEPLFGLGPHTVGQYVWEVESTMERGQEGWANEFDLIYGLSPNIALTTTLPYQFSRENESAGLGAVTLRGKYRFYRRDFRNGSDAFAFHAGIKLPGGKRAFANYGNSTDYFFALSFGRESRTRYAFADVRYLVRGSTRDLNRGNVWNFDAAYGIRPWRMEYLQPDLVLLLEALGEVSNRNTFGGRQDANSGGSGFSLAPGFFLSYRNVMLKGGVKFRVFQNLNGSQKKDRTEFLLAVDIHMPPFK